MAFFNIQLPEDTTLCAGKMITFKAPADCKDLTGITIEGSSYTLLNALGDTITEGAFVKGSMVSVILDPDALKAYILNAAQHAVQLVTWEEGD